MTEDEKVIVVKDLVSHYGDKLVLNRVSVEVRSGETVAIIGRSGCGKTTLLRNMVGLLKPTSGEVRILGEDIVRMKEPRMSEILKRIGMLFQTSALFNSMTIFENVSLPLTEHRLMDMKQAKERVAHVLEQVGLAGCEDMMPSELSEGMKKRAGLARAISADPDILFLDEPTTGLDPIIASEIDTLLRDLKDQQHRTMVMITHKITSAFKIADRVGMIQSGEVIARGTPEELKSTDDPYVRKFIGEVFVAEHERYGPN